MNKPKINHSIHAKESWSSKVTRTLHFESPVPKCVWQPNRPAFAEYSDLDGWVKVTLQNKLGNAIGTLSMKTSEMIDELTKIIEMLNNDESTIVKNEI